MHTFVMLFMCYILVIKQGRQFSYEKVDTRGINVMLNSKDVSEYLKLSPDGLEVCTAFVCAVMFYYYYPLVKMGNNN